MQLTLVWQLYLRSYFTLHMFEFHTETNNTHATLVVSHTPQTPCIWDVYAVPKTFSQNIWNDTCAKATFRRLNHVLCTIPISHMSFEPSLSPTMNSFAEFQKQLASPYVAVTSKTIFGIRHYNTTHPFRIYKSRERKLWIGQGLGDRHWIRESISK